MAGTLAADEGRSRKRRDDEQETLDPAALRRLLDALNAAADGDLSRRLPARRKGILGELEAAFNRLSEHSEGQTAELARVARQIGREGRMTERARADGAKGDYLERITIVNGLIDDLVRPTTEVARVIVAVAEGDLSQKMAMEIDSQPVKGEFARIGTTVNAMVDQLSSFASEVTRVAREVGTDGKLGGQAAVPGVSGTWADLTESVNSMAANLTGQVRNIAQVTTAVAPGDPGARAAGPGAPGRGPHPAESVNSMGANLPGQARNIPQGTTAVAPGVH